MIGVAWAILQPLTTMLIFTVVFGLLARMPSDGLPYPVFAFTGLLAWGYFAQALTTTGNSLVGDAALIRKVYFPRLIIPMASVARPILDLLPSLGILLGLMAWYGIAPSWRLVALPLFLLLAVATALSVRPLALRAQRALPRLGYTIPFLIQCLVFASPVVYPASLVPERWRLVYSLNPMAGVIEGFRWALLGAQMPRLDAARGECRHGARPPGRWSRLLPASRAQLRGRDLSEPALPSGSKPRSVRAEHGASAHRHASRAPGSRPALLVFPAATRASERTIWALSDVSFDGGRGEVVRCHRAATGRARARC